MADAPTPGRDRYLPFLSERGLSRRTRVLATACGGLGLLAVGIILTVAMALPPRTFVLLTATAIILFGLATISIIAAGQERDRWRRANAGREWAYTRYHIQLTQTEALGLFCRVEGRREIRPQVVGDSLVYGSATTVHHHAGVLLLYTPDLGYHLLDIATGHEVAPQ